MKRIDLPVQAFVLVSWVDSNYTLGWFPLEHQTAKMPKAETAGWISFVDDEMVEITGSMGEAGAKLNPLSIPWVSITEIEFLSRKEKGEGDSGSAPPSPAPVQESEDGMQDLPETVESDAEFNFRKLQFELDERVH